ncbi:MAG: hypothetical protein KKB50_13045, partial [Planctomycetes bacterium]|nr:hypothetical protein [Planctomycetota bacterium]
CERSCRYRISNVARDSASGGPDCRALVRTPPRTPRRWLPPAIDDGQILGVLRDRDVEVRVFDLKIGR